MKRRFVLFGVMFLMAYVVKSQIPKMPGIVPSPQAWNFAQYGKMPISHFTGLPNIEVSLDAVREGDLTIPISLNYNVGNVRPDIHPGVTGLGWNLSLGGVVTRKVRGLVDEFDYTQYVEYGGGSPNAIRFFNGYRNNSHTGLNDVTASSILKTTRPLLCQGSGATCNSNPVAAYIRSIPQILPYLWDDITYMHPNCSNGCNTYWLNTLGMNAMDQWNSDGHKDREPDEFSFNVMGLSGKFYLPRGNVTEVTDIVCNKKVRIRVSSVSQNIPLPAILAVPSYNGPGGTADNLYFNLSPWQHNNDVYPRTIWFFTITDEDGNTYYFGRTASDLNYNGSPDYAERTAIDYGINLYDISQDYWTADAWYLTRIVTPGGKSINYEYVRGDFQTNMFLSSYDSNVDDSSVSASFNRFDRGGRLISPATLYRIHSEGFDINLGYAVSKQLRFERNVSNFYVSKPGIPGTLYNTILDYVNVPDLKWYQLNSIAVKEYSSNPVYYNFSYTTDSTKRLMLNQVVSSNGVSDNEVYKFTYNTDSLPNYLSGQTDHWGFWNGKTPTSNNPYIFYNDKQPDTTRLYSGTLSQLQYPTGGITKFTYEPNEYSRIVKPVRTDDPDSAANLYGGGLRIKRIEDYDSIHSIPYNVREYFYKHGYNNTLNSSQIQALPSSGVLNMKPQYRWKGKSPYYNPSASVSDSTLFNVQSTQPLYYSTDDYQLGYSEVVEKTNDKSYSIYKFSNHDNGYKDEPYVDVLNNVFNSPFTKYTDMSFARGKLLDKSDYDSSNVIVAKKVISYTISDTSKPYINDCEASYFNNAAYHSGNSYISFNRWVLFGTQYKIYKYWTVPSSEQNYMYQNGQTPIVTQAKYFYNNPGHGRVSSEETIDSRGDTLTTLYKYAKDYSGEFMLNLINAWKPGTVLEKVIMKRNGNGQKIVGGQLNEFGLSSGGGMPWLNSVYSLQINTPIDSATQFGLTTPITRDFNGTAYSKDFHYKEVYKVNKYQGLDVPIEVVNQKGERVIEVRCCQNSFASATVSLPVEEIAYHLWGYTSFENYVFNDIEGHAVSEPDGEKDFIYSGIFTDSISFSGKRSFAGTITSKDYVHACDIYVLAKHGGNAPIYQYLSGITTYTGTSFTKIGETGGWDIYKVSHSNGGTKIIVNSNGNFIDEVRILANQSKAFMTTYCYENGLISTMTDRNFARSFYEYDEYRRLKLIKDEDGKILKRIEYKIQGNIQQ
jgi:hypothetical protein